MKYKIMGLSTAALVLIAVLVVSFMMPTDNGKRYHQHIEAEEKTVCTHTDGRFCTHLPIVKIDTNGETIPGEVILDGSGNTVAYTMSAAGEETILSKFSVVDNSGRYNHTEDTSAVSSDIRIRIRGNSSRHFEKKGYIIKMITSEGLNNPQRLKSSYYIMQDLWKDGEQYES